MQRVSKVMLFIIKTHSEVFKSDVWKEIGSIDSTIELLVTELQRINKETHYISQFSHAELNNSTMTMVEE